MIKDNFALSVLSYLKNQEVEIYCGDSGETQRFSETEATQKNLIRGILKDACGDCLVVQVTKGDKYATVYLNGWCIKTIVAIKDPLFIMDIYEDEEYGLTSKR